MKVNRDGVKKSIKYAIGRSVWNGEEIDVTTKAIMEIIEPLINYAEHGKITPEDDQTSQEAS